MAKFTKIVVEAFDKVCQQGWKKSTLVGPGSGHAQKGLTAAFQCSEKILG